MKKIYLLLIFTVILSSCGTKTELVQNKENKKTIATTQDTDKKENIENNKVENNTWNNKLLEIEDNSKDDYNKKIKDLFTIWETEKDKLSVLSTTNCTWVCNLDLKSQLTANELKYANSCFKRCTTLQKNAKVKLDKIRKQEKKKMDLYPGKCISDAEQKYQQYLSVNNEEDMIPKEDFINEAKNNCILMYWYTKYDCEKIKDYNEPYNECKRLRKFKQDLDFVNRNDDKSFEDYLNQWF